MKITMEITEWYEVPMYQRLLKTLSELHEEGKL